MASDALESLDLTGTQGTICLNDETRQFRFAERVGNGTKGVTWRTEDRFDRQYAVKLVHKSDYKDYSLEAEVLRTKSLSPRFAEIHFYGELKVFGSDIPQPNVFAVVSQWIAGVQLKDYISSLKTSLGTREFIELTKQFCEALALLEEQSLCHNDLHDQNILISRERQGPDLAEELVLRIIDMGSMTTKERKVTLLQRWRNDLEVLQENSSDELAIEKRRSFNAWFERTDQEWVVSHLVSLVNTANRLNHDLPVKEKRFFDELPKLLLKMVDADLSIRIDSPQLMYGEVERLLQRMSEPPQPTLTNPFEYISAELIRNDETLTLLFSKECPWYKRCFSTDPIYLYGPRGCGKTTVLRMLSLPVVLSERNSKEIFQGRQYIGIYISCTEVLRSRFLLFPEERYETIEADLITFFTCLLTEALLDTLELLRDDNLIHKSKFSVGFTNERARHVSEIVCDKFSLEPLGGKLKGVSWLVYAKKRLTVFRNDLWQRMLTTPTASTPNPMLLFDLCSELETAFPLLREKHLAFLLDDYSNQRIPAKLQRVLNQTISFAKQGNPIFKVSSEYQGVDLDGIQEGREVVEINVGAEYVDLGEVARAGFLEDVLNIRFHRSGRSHKVKDLLGIANVSQGIPLARAINAANKGDKPVYYHGVDTIAELCSGDLAMALNLVRQIDDLSIPTKLYVSPKQQHEIIHRYSDREHMYLRYHSPYGAEMSNIADALCWLAHEAAVTKTSKKDGVAEPMIKTHLDIKGTSLAELKPELKELMNALVKWGAIFTLDTSRTRYGSEGTERYQIRRILLAKYIAPLSRRDPIKLDTPQRIIFLLTEPMDFAKSEIGIQPRIPGL